MINFKLDEKSERKIDKWIKTLPPSPDGAIGGRISYCFTPTYIGIVVKVKDSVSNQELDITDYDSW